MAATCNVVPVRGAFFLNQLLSDVLEPDEFSRAARQCYKHAENLSKRAGKAITPAFVYKECDGNVEVFLTNDGTEEKIYECRKQ